MHMHLANVCVFVFEFADVYNVYVKHVPVHVDVCVCVFVSVNATVCICIRYTYMFVDGQIGLDWIRLDYCLQIGLD